MANYNSPAQERWRGKKIAKANWLSFYDTGFEQVKRRKMTQESKLKHMRGMVKFNINTPDFLAGYWDEVARLQNLTDEDIKKIDPAQRGHFNV